MRIAIVGATGLVGQEMLKVLGDSSIHVNELIPAASERSLGQEVDFRGRKYAVVSIEQALAAKPEIALFSAGGNVSKEYAPRFAATGTTVIDNSSAWRMDPGKPLVVPEINAKAAIGKGDKIIANPNCSTIQMVMALAPLHWKYQIKRVVVSTYQSVTGTGKEAVQQMMDERQGKEDSPKAYPHPIDQNVLPHIDAFQNNGYTKEEMKMILETKKIFNDDSVAVTATTVRLPVMGGHSESVNVEFANDFDLEEVKGLLQEMPGVVVEDDPANNIYPMPLNAHHKDEVFVGRLRRDETQANTLNFWCVADNLRKGAATNAVQIAEFLVREGLVHKEEVAE